MKDLSKIKKLASELLSAVEACESAMQDGDMLGEGEKPVMHEAKQEDEPEASGDSRGDDKALAMKSFKMKLGKYKA